MKTEEFVNKYINHLSRADLNNFKGKKPSFSHETFIEFRKYLGVLIMKAGFEDFDYDGHSVYLFEKPLCSVCNPRFQFSTFAKMHDFLLGKINK